MGGAFWGVWGGGGIEGGGGRWREVRRGIRGEGDEEGDEEEGGGGGGREKGGGKRGEGKRGVENTNSHR